MKGGGKPRGGKGDQAGREEETRKVERGRIIELIFILIDLSPVMQRHFADKYLCLIKLTIIRSSIW